jgi:hypothetical protein
MLSLLRKLVKEAVVSETSSALRQAGLESGSSGERPTLVRPRSAGQFCDPFTETTPASAFRIPQSVRQTATSQAWLGVIKCDTHFLAIAMTDHNCAGGSKGPRSHHPFVPELRGGSQSRRLRRRRSTAVLLFR